MLCEYGFTQAIIQFLNFNIILILLISKHFLLIFIVTEAINVRILESNAFPIAIQAIDLFVCLVYEGVHWEVLLRALELIVHWLADYQFVFQTIEEVPVLVLCCLVQVDEDNVVIEEFYVDHWIRQVFRRL